MTAQDIRDDLLRTIDHIERITNKLDAISGIRGNLTFPDYHKLSEGLFLSAWSHWEEFTRTLLIHDLATDSTGVLRTEIKLFRTKGAAARLAERVANHPDHPDKYVEWSDYNLHVVPRAKEFLGPGNRFVSGQLPRIGDFSHLKRIRNAIAHKGDKAWDSFRKLVSGPPFSIPPAQMRGITPGRFLVAHSWNGKSVLLESLQILKAGAKHLVP